MLLYSNLYIMYKCEMGSHSQPRPFYPSPPYMTQHNAEVSAAVESIRYCTKGLQR